MINVFDIEARNWNEFICAGCLSNEGFYQFTDIDSLWKHLLSIGGIWYAHVGGRYDFRFLAPYLEGTNAKCIIRNSSMLKIQIDKLILRDSYALLPYSLKKLGESFETEHRKLDIDKDNLVDSPQLREYNRNDCYTLSEAIKAFEEEVKVLKPTISSQAMMSLDSGYALKEKKVYRENKVKEEFFREGYYGGRVDVFKRYDKHIYLYDVNSMYGSVMRQPLPCSKCIEVDHFYEDRLGIYEIEWECYNDGIVPVLPMRIKGSLIFGIGKGHGIYPSPEIKLASSMGYKIKVIRGYIWLDQQPLLKEYVEYWYQKRQEGKSQALIAKLMINSLYGRFAIREVGENLRFKPPTIEAIKKGEQWRIYNEEKDIWTQEVKLKLRNVYIQLSAFITSYARVALYQYLDKCKDSLYYCDTDSIATTRELKTSHELGKLKLEIEGEGIFLSPKLYAIRHRDGVRIAAKGYFGKELGFEDFEEALKGNTGAISTRKILLRGIKESLKKDGDLLALLEKHRMYSGNFLKRQLMPNGIDTKAYIHV